LRVDKESTGRAENTPEAPAKWQRSGNGRTEPAGIAAHFLAAQRKPPEVKDGLSEQARRKVWWEMVAAGDRAEREAPQEPTRRDALKNKYRKAVLARHKVTEQQWEQIRTEAQINLWPTPEP
jgi:hypothetical protein